MAPQLLTLWTHLNKIFLIHTTQQQSPVTNQNKNLKKNSRDDQNKLQAQKKNSSSFYQKLLLVYREVASFNAQHVISRKTQHVFTV